MINKKVKHACATYTCKYGVSIHNPYEHYHESKYNSSIKEVKHHHMNNYESQ